MPFVCAALILGLSALPARAAAPAATPTTEAEMEALVNAVRANRKALVAVNLNLSAAEAEKFWPLYDRYQVEISAIGDRILAIVNDYIAHFRDLSDEKALQLMTDYLAAEAERVKVRQTYLPEFAKILPGRTVARFYQLDNKMDALIRYDLAATIPVMDEGRSAAGQ
jgi:hypothetical protein